MDREYKASFVIASFSGLEIQLQSCMEFIPYAGSNKKVVSPKFVPIIMEGCSLIDSVFNQMTSDNTERFNLKRYSELHENQLLLEENISLFLNTPLQVLQPYKDWTKKQPEWWRSEERRVGKECRL